MGTTANSEAGKTTGESDGEALGHSAPNFSLLADVRLSLSPRPTHHTLNLLVSTSTPTPSSPGALLPVPKKRRLAASPRKPSARIKTAKQPVHIHLMANSPGGRLFMTQQNLGEDSIPAIVLTSSGGSRIAIITANGDMQHNGNQLSLEDIPAILREHLAHTNPGPTSTAARSSDDPPTNTTATSSAPTTTNTATATSSAPTTNNTATPTSTSSAPPTNTTATPTADCEQAFSTLKRVKTRLRSSLKTSLNNLLKISIDGPHIDDFNF
ncbi:hypothetical protein Bbelb_350380 [Branchiostoma belcheri]|nr:hypothetical protein Bbelb_350380 [Branchiostoma belcheri]